MTKKIDAQIADLSQRYADAQALLTPELLDAHKLQLLVNSLQEEENNLTQKLDGINKELDEKKKQLVCMDEEILVQEFGLYTPQYDFASALDYKEALAKIRQVQKDLIKEKKAVLGSTEWTVNIVKPKGEKNGNLILQKLLLRDFQQ